MKNKIWVGLLFLILALPVFSASNDNLLKNGGFESGLKNKIPVDWGTEYYNCELDKNKKEGQSSLRITNKTPAMSLGAQTVALDGRKIRRIFVSCWVKGENIVAGKEDWQKANIQPLFFNEKNEQVGGWPQMGPWTGTFNWQFIKKGFVVPSEARSLKLVFGLYNATGSVWFDDFKVALETPKAQDPYNFVSNGDFEIWENWAYGGTEGGGIISPGYKGNGMLYINNPIRNWSFASQSIGLPSNATKIKIDAWVKTKDIIPGNSPWQKGRINIEFIDGQGKRLGGWPIVKEFIGSSDWQKVSNSFAVPKGTVRVDLFAGLMECTGSIWVDELSLTVYSQGGGRLSKKASTQTETNGWFTFDQEFSSPKNTAVDVSFLLDPPAGKHGFMRVKNGHFYFEDGTRARFWGTNVYGTDCFVDKKTAEQMADRLASFGCNLVRLHHLDAFWSNPNIFDPKKNDTQSLNKDALDQLDYFVWQLEKRGIYIFMDLLVDREFKEGDKVEDWQHVERGAKFSGFFNRRIIDLQKKFAKDLLQHRNRYTRKRYVEDPAVVSYKILNEGMLYYISTQFNLSPVYMKELDKLWNNWLVKKYGGRDRLAKAWSDKYGRQDLREDEDPYKVNVKRGSTLLKFQRGGASKVEPLRDQDTMEFYYDLQVKYFKEMQGFLKGIGAKVPISGSNHWINIDADVKANAALDYIDRHRYWDHPKYGYGTEIVFENQPMVLFPQEALPNNFAYYKVANKPFSISEWNCAFPNEYRVEGPMMMAAYSVLQDWDAVIQFSFSGATWKLPMQDNFDIGAWPNVFGQWPTAALLFYRQDVSVAKNVIEETLSDYDIFGQIREDEPIFQEPFLPLICRTQKRYVKNLNDLIMPEYETLVAQFHDKEKKIVTSDTQQIKWNYGEGLFTIDSDRTQGALGFLSQQLVNLKNVSILSQTKFASIMVSSLQKKPLEKSNRILVCAGARVENSGQKYNAAKTQLTSVGSKPLLVEGVSADISIETDKNNPQAKVFALDMNGAQKAELPVTSLGKKIKFHIAPQYKALFYEVKIN